MADWDPCTIMIYGNKAVAEAVFNNLVDNSMEHGGDFLRFSKFTGNEESDNQIIDEVEDNTLENDSFKGAWYTISLRWPYGAPCDEIDAVREPYKEQTDAGLLKIELIFDMEVTY